MFDSLLIANRGEIARRVIRTATRLGIRTVAVYSDADAGLPFVAEADDAIRIGPPAPGESYLDAAAVLAAAKESGASAIHPGYGFLSENADFAEAVGYAGLIWVGPSPESIRSMGDKIEARNLMASAGVPVAPGSGEPVADGADALRWAERIGYPVMVKAAGGGGGIGMAPAADPDALLAAFETARSRAERFFSNGGILLERFVPAARHVEVQILGLADGRVVAVGDRDCSVQRRHQKLVEEGPATGLDEAQRDRIRQAAVLAGEAVDYRGAGTVEMLLDRERGDAWFLEMNTRLQVEHPVTEETTGLDLVEQQLLIAAGCEPTFDADNPPETAGHAIEFRVCAEDPRRFLPGPGEITEWVEPSGVGIRVDA
ncbi:MAG: biotin carboxylase N-terminal domain-containing protein, partial [Candidatus Nanopelagicales bacterium]|nr:biotin carboxylase N-terminal domain-containing protein [Candidatus Nanopelagicales bacterium]